MTKTKKHYDLHALLEEIAASEGLPENLSTEAQLWDEIMKKETFLMPEQLFPLIREDITVIVAERDIYHFECEIQNDGTMVMRMFEYDVHIALSYQQGTPEQIVLQFPHSAVLYLQDNGNTPDELHCTIRFQDGGTYEYRVPVLKVQTYTIEEIKEKHLCVLIPFLPLRFRRQLSAKGKGAGVKKEELTSFYQELILVLEEEVEAGYLSDANRKTIIALLGKSMIRVFYRDEAMLKEVVEMTEPILELEFEKYEKVIEEQARVLEEKDRTLQEKDRALSKQQSALTERDAEIAELKKKIAEMERVNS